MYPGPPTETDRRVSWQSVTAGFVLNAAMLAVLVAASHPVAAGVVVAAATGLYVLYRLLARAAVLERPTFVRTLRLSRNEVSVCLQLRLE